jgi:hypothetical protein
LTVLFNGGGTAMSGVAGKRRFPSLIETVVAEKGDGIQEVTAATIQTDAAVVLESLVAEFSTEVVLAAMRNQGVSAEAYMSTLGALAQVARARRVQRIAGVAE